MLLLSVILASILNLNTLRKYCFMLSVLNRLKIRKIMNLIRIQILKQLCGKIITIGSMASYFGCTTVPAYTATKGAVAQLTKSVAVDCAGRGININCICPGYMDTEMCANMTQERKDECTKRIPAGRWGLPEDMKGPVVFLASAASDYLNGALIPVDGGYLVK